MVLQHTSQKKILIPSKFKGIVNGTPCTLHSLSWTDANVNAQMQQFISMAPDDEIVMLTIPPDYVNVQINGQTTWDPNDSLLGSEAYVIPVPIAKKRLIVNVGERARLPVAATCPSSKHT